MTFQADVGLQRASKQNHALFNWRRPRTGLQRLGSLQQSLRLEDDGAVSRPQKWGREMGPVPAVQLGTKYGGCETATPKLSPPGGPNFGAANSSIFRLNLALYTRGPTDKRSKRKTENHDLRKQLSCGSERSGQHERNVHRGGPRTRSQNC